MRFDLVNPPCELKAPLPRFTRRQTEAAVFRAAGMTARQIAMQLGLSRGAVRQRLRRARRRAERQCPALLRYSEALAKPGQVPKRMRPFSLLPTDHV